MTLSSLELSMIRHIVANEMAPTGQRISDKEFCETVKCSPETLRKYTRVRCNCKKCEWTFITSQDLPKSCKDCGGEVEYRPLNPEFYQTLQSALNDARDTGDFYGLTLHQWGLEQLKHLYDKARTPTEQERILSKILAQTKDAVPFTGAVDYSHLTDDQLIETALGRLDNTLESGTKLRLLELSKGA